MRRKITQSTVSLRHGTKKKCFSILCVDVDASVNCVESFSTQPEHKAITLSPIMAHNQHNHANFVALKEIQGMNTSFTHYHISKDIRHFSFKFSPSMFT